MHLLIPVEINHVRLGPPQRNSLTQGVLVTALYAGTYNLAPPLELPDPLLRNITRWPYCRCPTEEGRRREIVQRVHSGFVIREPHCKRHAVGVIDELHVALVTTQCLVFRNLDRRTPWFLFGLRITSELDVQNHLFKADKPLCHARGSQFIRASRCLSSKSAIRGIKNSLPQYSRSQSCTTSRASAKCLCLVSEITLGSVRDDPTPSPRVRFRLPL